MNVNFVHDGAAIDYTPAVDTPAGSVVVRFDLVGVTKLDIKADELGSLHVKGVFDFPKETGGGKAIEAGRKVYWNDSSDFATKSAGGGVKYIGKATMDAADDDEFVRVRMEQ